MTKRVVEHKIKLEKSVKIILGVLAFGVFLNAFAPVFDVKDAFARPFDIPPESYVYVTNLPDVMNVKCVRGCK